MRRKRDSQRTHTHKRSRLQGRGGPSCRFSCSQCSVSPPSISSSSFTSFPHSSELQSLRRRCDLQGRELNHVKRLARRILDQRTETETFFLEALSHVRREVAANRYVQVCLFFLLLYYWGVDLPLKRLCFKISYRVKNSISPLCTK